MQPQRVAYPLNKEVTHLLSTLRWDRRRQLHPRWQRRHPLRRLGYHYLADSSTGMGIVAWSFGGHYGGKIGQPVSGFVSGTLDHLKVCD